MLFTKDVYGQVTVCRLPQHSRNHLRMKDFLVLLTRRMKDLDLLAIMNGNDGDDTFHCLNASRLASIVALSPAPPAT